MRDFDSLSEREVLALAIFLEEEDERIYADFADRLRERLARPAGDVLRSGERDSDRGVYPRRRAGCAPTPPGRSSDRR